MNIDCKGAMHKGYPPLTLGIFDTPSHLDCSPTLQEMRLGSSPTEIFHSIGNFRFLYTALYSYDGLFNTHFYSASDLKYVFLV